jgi:hypothetical protein
MEPLHDERLSSLRAAVRDAEAAIDRLLRDSAPHFAVRRARQRAADLRMQLAGAEIASQIAAERVSASRKTPWIGRYAG